GLRDHDEVVPADVADEVAVAAVALIELVQQGRGEADHRVAARVAVVVVECLELVEVEMEERELLPGRDPSTQLGLDQHVAGTARQRVRRELGATRLELIPDAEEELLLLPRLRQ